MGGRAWSAVRNPLCCQCHLRCQCLCCCWGYSVCGCEPSTLYVVFVVSVVNFVGVCVFAEDTVCVAVNAVPSMLSVLSVLSMLSVFVFLLRIQCVGLWTQYPLCCLCWQCCPCCQCLCCCWRHSACSHVVTWHDGMCVQVWGSTLPARLTACMGCLASNGEWLFLFLDVRAWYIEWWRALCLLRHVTVT